MNKTFCLYNIKLQTLNYKILLQTRVLVTHGVSFLPQVDKIIVISEGTVSEVGTFEQLVENNGSFAEFLATHAESEY